jgi:hypothetical protein
VAEQAHRHRERDGLRGAGLEADPDEPDQLLSGQCDVGGRVGGIQLDDLGPGAVPAVRDRQGHPCFAGHVDGVALELQRAVVEGRVAEAVAEREQRRGGHVEVAVVDVGRGAPVAAAGLLAVVDRHLSDVPRQRDRQLPCGVGDPEQRVGDRGALVRSPVVAGEDRGQPVDDRGEALRSPHRDDGDGRLADRGHGVHELDLLWRQVDVRGVAALLLGEARTSPPCRRCRG